jgi:hypothetical protein
MIKQLRRTVIIRQYDYDRKVHGPAASLYDTCTFDPYLRKTLEQEYIHRTLSDTMPEHTQLHHYRYNLLPADGIGTMLLGQHDRLYNVNYIKANWEEDSDGYIWIWYRSNTPRSILGLATFEYSYTGRDHDHSN